MSLTHALYLCLIATGPGFAVLVLVSKRIGYRWLAALLGGLGWFIALLLRYPVFIPLTIYFGASSIIAYAQAGLAGVFEEPVRYFIIRYFYREKRDEKIAYSIGLGWGVAEALALYVLPILVVYSTTSFMKALPGAIERNTAILFHVSASNIILTGIKKSSIGYLAVAIVLHGLLDITAIKLLYIVGEPFLLEGILALITLTVFIFSCILVAVE